MTDERGQREGDDDRDQREDHRDEALRPIDPKDEEDDERGRKAELQLALLQVLLRQALVVLVRGELPVIAVSNPSRSAASTIDTSSPMPSSPPGPRVTVTSVACRSGETSERSPVA